MSNHFTEFTLGKLSTEELKPSRTSSWMESRSHLESATLTSQRRDGCFLSLEVGIKNFIPGTRRCGEQQPGAQSTFLELPSATHPTLQPLAYGQLMEGLASGANGTL